MKVIKSDKIVKVSDCVKAFDDNTSSDLNEILRTSRKLMDLLDKNYKNLNQKLKKESDNLYSALSAFNRSLNSLK